MGASESLRRVHLGSRQPANWVQLLKFAIVGASGYVVNLAVFAALAEGAGVHHISAAVAAFCVAVTSNFICNRHWTFGAGAGDAGFQAPRFLAVSVVALALNLALLQTLVSGAGAPELASQAIAVAFSMPVNFVGNKLWTFGSHQR